MNMELDNGLHNVVWHVEEKQMQILNKKTQDLVTLTGLEYEKYQRILDVVFNRE
jgi:hypothetical protein